MCTNYKYKLLYSYKKAGSPKLNEHEYFLGG